MAQIYVNSGLVKPKSIHIWNSSAQLWEEEKIGYVRVNGEWVPFIEYTLYIYNKGIENISLVDGYTTTRANRKITMNSAHITFDLKSSQGGSTAHHTIVTDSSLNLTNYKTLKLSLLDISIFTSQSLRDAYLFISPDKTANYFGNYVARYKIARFQSNTVVEIDVTSLIGDFYVLIGMATPDASSMYINFDELYLE